MARESKTLLNRSRIDLSMCKRPYTTLFLHSALCLFQRSALLLLQGKHMTLSLSEQKSRACSSKTVKSAIYLLNCRRSLGTKCKPSASSVIVRKDPWHLRQNLVRIPMQIQAGQVMLYTGRSKARQVSPDGDCMYPSIRAFQVLPASSVRPLLRDFKISGEEADN